MASTCISLCGILFLLSSADVLVSAGKKLASDLSAAKLVHSAVLDEGEKYHLSWDFDDEKIVFEVRVQTLGYVGFGLSPNGGMMGADIVIGGVSNGTADVYFSDQHGTGNLQPTVDEMQDWTLVTGSQNDTHTTLRFWRKLDTCDKDDIPVTTDTTRVIWAYRDADWEAAGSSKYHGTNRGSKSLLLLNPQRTPPEMPQDAITFDFLNSDAKVPAEDTTYWCQVFSTHHLQEKHHIIKFEPVIHKGHESLVHHIVLYACLPGTTNETAGRSGSCFDPSNRAVWRNCMTSIYAWAVGGGPFYLPDHVGYPFGSEGDAKMVLLETHFDNPEKRSGMVDSSGLRLTLTPSLRQHDAGTLVVGVPVYKTQVIPPFAEDFRTDGHCLPQCLQQGMENVSSVKAFAGFLHAHLLGVAIKFRHFREGKEQRPIIQDEHYDFNFQETRMLEEEVEIKSTDHLVSECHYSSTQRKSVTFGGFSTTDEMCETYIMYYPKIELSYCYTGVHRDTLASFANVTVYENFTVSNPVDLRGESLFDVINVTVDWTDEQTRARFERETTSPDKDVWVMCLGADNRTYPANNQVVKLPEIKKVFVAPDPCPEPSSKESVTSGSAVIVMSFILGLFHFSLEG